MAVRDVMGKAVEQIFCGPEDAGGSSEEELVAAAKCEAALRELRELKPEQEQAIRLCHLEGMTLQEAANAAGIRAHSTMQYRCEAALDALRRAPAITKIRDAADSVVYLPNLMRASQEHDLKAGLNQGKLTLHGQDCDDAGAAEVRKWEARWDAHLDALAPEERKRLRAERRRTRAESCEKEKDLHKKLYGGIGSASDCKPVSHRQRRDRDRNLNRKDHRTANRAHWRQLELLQSKRSDKPDDPEFPRAAKQAAIAQSWLGRHWHELLNYRRPARTGRQPVDSHLDRLIQTFQVR